MRNPLQTASRGLVLLALLAGTVPRPLAAGELVGVAMPDAIEVGGRQLVLNGMGLRKKAIIKIYVAGLYLLAPQSDPAAILAADAPRRLGMEFLFAASAERTRGAWVDCLEKNVPAASADVRAKFAALNGYMEDLEKGDLMAFTYLPGVGTSVEIGLQGGEPEVKGTLAGKPFADALFSCWLGPEPPGAAFKQGLLGG